MSSARSKATVALGDPWVLLAALALACLGLVMVYSASSALALKRYGEASYFLQRQVFHLLAGLALMTFLAWWDYQRLRAVVWPALALVLLGLALVFVPGLGREVGGAARWLHFGGHSLQPAEFAKLALVIFLAHTLAKHHQEIKSLRYGFGWPLALTLLLALPVLVQPDFGMSITMLMLTVIMLFVAGSRLRYLAALLLAAVPALYLLIRFFPYRMQRLLTFLDPWRDPAGAGFQLVHSFLALGSGGLWGTGLGGSRQKLFYLPEPHTDFIFSVLGEELGLWGAALVLSLFMVLIWRGVKIALSARDFFGSYLALGATLIIGLQAFINAAVVMGCLPTKGLTLPFISYGGSSLLVNCACVGLLLSVARFSGRPA